MLSQISQMSIVLPLAALAGCAVGSGGGTTTGAVNQVVYLPFMDLNGATVQKIGPSNDLAKMAASAGGVQQKFETDADFNLRMSNLKPFEICKSISESSLKFDSSTGVARYKEFLSDSQISGYREKNGETLTNHNIFMPDLDISFGSTKTGEYTGQNSFGATTVVETRKAENIHLVLDPIYKGPLSFPHPYIEADAGSLVAKHQQAFLCITGIPVAPFYRQSVFHSSPTLANPYDGQITHHFFRVKIGGARFSDSKGNTIPGTVAVNPGI